MKRVLANSLSAVNTSIFDTGMTLSVSSTALMRASSLLEPHPPRSLVCTGTAKPFTSTAAVSKLLVTLLIGDTAKVPLGTVEADPDGLLIAENEMLLISGAQGDLLE